MEMPERKIDILIPDFSDFGAQRVAINVANGLSREYEVNFIVFDDSGPFKEYLNKEIRVVKLDYGATNIKKIRILPRFFRYRAFSVRNKSDIAISFSPVTNLVILVAKLFNKRLKVVIQEHCFPTIALKDRQNMPIYLEWLFRFVAFKLYNGAEAFITSTKAIVEDFVDNFGIRREIFHVVRNPVDIEKIVKIAAEPVTDFNFEPGKKYLLGAGRLVDQKDFFKLLRVFALVKKRFGAAELIILGEGPDRQGLEEEAERLGLSASVHLVGFKRNLDSYITQADCFCLSSRWEAMPQVMSEAMICKTPIIANDCKAGPNEMLIDGETGFLIPMEDEELFTQRIVDVLENPDLQQKIAENAFVFASREYSIEQCVINYKSIINQIA
jgi:glycosyltransferase involved in cell wall biosynthesis